MKTQKLQIPLEIIRHAYANNMINAFRVFICLKINTSGKVKSGSNLFTLITVGTGVKDKRTIEKHLNLLLSINWIGYCRKSGYYYIRGFSFIRKTLQLRNRTAVTFHPHYFKNFQTFLVGAILGQEIHKQKFFEVAQRRRLRNATNMQYVANQPQTRASSSNFKFIEKRQYFGLSNKSIGVILGCKQTRACILKNQAAKCGFITVKHHFKILSHLEVADPQLKEARKYWDNGHKVRFRRALYKGKSVIQIIEQETDEIIPRLRYLSIRKFANLQ